jgi:hypothetical protein
MELADELVGMLMDGIQGYCPPFVFFGALSSSEPDNFGFWPDWEALDKPRPWWDSHRTIQLQQDQKVLIQFDLGRSNVTVMDMDRNVLWTTT